MALSCLRTHLTHPPSSDTLVQVTFTPLFRTRQPLQQKPLCTANAARVLLYYCPLTQTKFDHYRHDVVIMKTFVARTKTAFLNKLTWPQLYYPHSGQMHGGVELITLVSKYRAPSKRKSIRIP